MWWLYLSSPVHNAFGAFGVGYDRAVPGEPWSHGAAHLCLDGAAEATVEEVTADPGGLTVVDFAVRPLGPRPDPVLGTNTAPLTDMGFSERSFDAQCEAEEYVELGVQLTRGESGPASTEGFDVHWTAGVRSGVLRVPVSVLLCTPAETADVCDADARGVR